MSSMRCFLSAEIGPNVAGRAQTLIGKLKASSAKVNWVRSGQLHFTMSFLGDVQDRELPKLITAIKAAVVELPCFDVLCRGLGVFPSIDNPRTIWVGVTTGAEEMIELHNRLEQAIGELGFKGEGRRFRPHLTLGRVRSLPNGSADLRELLAEYAEFEVGLMTVAEVTLYSSELQPHGPTYEPLGHAELLG